MAPRCNIINTEDARQWLWLTDTTGAEGKDTLANVERPKFSDGGIALDTGATQSAGQAQLLLGAVLGKDLPAAKKPLVDTGIGLFEPSCTSQRLSGTITRRPVWRKATSCGMAESAAKQTTVGLAMTGLEFGF